MEQEVTQEKSILLETDTKEGKCPLPWWKRIGFLGFMFFLIKGLGWVAVFVISWIWGPEALDSVRAFFANLF